MTTFDHTSKRASRDWLNFALKKNGYLRSGEVIAVQQRRSRIGTTLTSTFYQLNITYSSGFEDNAPSSCLMKIGKPDLFSATKAEAAFYEHARSGRPTEGLLRSFATDVDESLQSAVILLEDRTDCAAPSEWPLPPTIDVCERAIRSLATVHGRWWNSAELDDPSFEKSTYHLMTVKQRSALLASFFEFLGDRLSQDRRATLENLSDSYDRVIQDRIEQTNARTLVHGDAHFWNFLYPADVSRPPLLIDWQTFFVHLAAFDLAYMIALHWFPERRQRFEKSLLHAYLDQLERQGVKYAFDDLWHDYRLQVAGLMFFPIKLANKVPAAVWWPHLDRAFSAFDDLGCREFF